MAKVKFIFCVHNHQPIGNFGWVFDKAYQAAYEPFLKVMMKHPKIKWNLHSSGMLWEYLTKEHPQYIKSIKELIDKGNVEVLSGGYYEPIMPALPQRDRVGQIKKMNAYLKNKFGCKEINGIWLAERVWEPNLAKTISESDIKYTVLDDAHFVASGMDANTLNGYYTTEEEGAMLNIFPISQKMRYNIPFKNPQDTIDYFRYLSQQESEQVVVFADDGEKLGLWTGTNKHVYQNGWLESFLTALEENSDIVETTTFSEVYKSQKPSGRVYLPCASYFEMSEWALTNLSQQKFEQVLHKYGGDNELKLFLRGGFWRNFLTKYEEANNMQKKMLYVSQKIAKHIENSRPLAQEALEYLYAGQCNCGYWHGVFGGLYLPHLRNALYNNLIMAEGIYNDAMIIKPEWTLKDINCDSNDEYLYESKSQNIYVQQIGGSIYEWDIFKINRNFTDTLTRRFESNHDHLRNNAHNAILASDDDQEVHNIHDEQVKVKEFGLENYLVYDDYQRTSLIDHFFDNNIDIENFMYRRYEEKGNFIWQNYKSETKSAKLILSSDGKVCENDFKVEKTIIPQVNGYIVEYSVENKSKDALDICFAPEQVFAFSSIMEDDYKDLKNIKEWKRYDQYLNVEMELRVSQECDLFSVPIETVSDSENGFEKIYQGSSIILLFRGSIQPNKPLKFSFEVEVKFK